MTPTAAALQALRTAAGASQPPFAFRDYAGANLGFQIFLTLPPRVYLPLLLREVRVRWDRHTSPRTYAPWAGACFAAIDMMLLHSPLAMSEYDPWVCAEAPRGRLPHPVQRAVTSLWGAAASQAAPVACAAHAALAVQRALEADYFAPRRPRTPAGWDRKFRVTFGAGWLGVAQAVEEALGAAEAQ